MVNRFSMIAALGFGVLASAAWAQDDALQCEDKGQNGMVAMLLCPEGLDHDALKAEGEAVCDGRKPCGAWMWTDEAVIPAEAPDAHDKLPKSAVIAAVAIWMNELDQLILLQAEANQ